MVESQSDDRQLRRELVTFMVYWKTCWRVRPIFSMAAAQHIYIMGTRTRVQYRTVRLGSHAQSNYRTRIVAHVAEVWIFFATVERARTNWYTLLNAVFASLFFLLPHCFFDRVFHKRSSLVSTASTRWHKNVSSATLERIHTNWYTLLNAVFASLFFLLSHYFSHCVFHKRSSLVSTASMMP